MFHTVIKIQGLPKTTNSGGRQHWALKVKEAKHWHQLVELALGTDKPVAPCQTAEITCTRYSAKEPDYDGLVSSFKHVIDGLVRAGVLIDDNMQVIVSREYCWHKVSPKKGYIEVEVYGEYY